MAVMLFMRIYIELKWKFLPIFIAVLNYHFQRWILTEKLKSGDENPELFMQTHSRICF